MKTLADALSHWLLSLLGLASTVMQAKGITDVTALDSNTLIVILVASLVTTANGVRSFKANPKVP